MDTLCDNDLVTAAAEGLPRRKWAFDDIVRMQDAGIIGENERFELIGGEIVPMSPKGNWHEELKRKLIVYFARALAADCGMVTETTLRYGKHDFLEPDFIFWPEVIPLLGLAAKDLHLLIEVSDSSYSYDLGLKAKLYAERGLREYWVMNARTFRTRVHLGRTDQGYTDIRDVEYTERLVPTLVPALAITIADLGLVPTRE